MPFQVAFFQYRPHKTGQYHAEARAPREKLIINCVRSVGFKATRVEIAANTRMVTEEKVFCFFSGISGFTQSMKKSLAKKAAALMQ